MPLITAPSGTQWYFEISGTGEPLIFLHGWGVSNRIWRQQLKEFSKSFTVIGFDLPGHGKSNWKPVTLDAMADDLLAIINQIGFQQFTLIGSSFGGMLSIKVAERAPHRVKRLVFVGSQPKFAQSEDYPHGLEVERIKKLATQLQSDYTAMIRVFFRSLFTKEERRTRRFKWIQTFRKQESLPKMDAVMGILDILEKEDLRESLKKIHIPIQFIYGEEDYICPAHVYDDLKKDFPAARFDCFEKVGHFPFLIYPDRFNEVLGDFLKNDSTLN